MKELKHRVIYITIFILSLLSAFTAYREYRHSKAIEVKDNQILALTDTVTVYKTKQGKNAAYTRIVEGSKNEIQTILNRTNNRLAEVLRSTRGLRTLTELRVETRTDTIVKVDTLELPSDSEPLFIQKEIKNNWYTAKITIKGDSLSLNHTSINKFDFVTKDKSNGFFKPTSYVIDVTNLNPYTYTTGLQSYEVQPKPKTWLKIGIGVLLGIGTVLLLK